MAEFGLEGVTKKRLIRFIGNNENWDTRMIGYRLKRALIVGDVRGEASLKGRGVLASGIKGILPAGGVFWGFGLRGFGNVYVEWVLT